MTITSELTVAQINLNRYLHSFFVVLEDASQTQHLGYFVHVGTNALAQGIYAYAFYLFILKETFLAYDHWNKKVGLLAFDLGAYYQLRLDIPIEFPQININIITTSRIVSFDIKR
jgi:hypothetical protein